MTTEFSAAVRCPAPPALPSVEGVGDGKAEVLSSGYEYLDQCEADDGVERDSVTAGPCGTIK